MFVSKKKFKELQKKAESFEKLVEQLSIQLLQKDKEIHELKNESKPNYFG